MPEQNDHDLLVRLDAKVEMLIQSITSFNAATKELTERVARLEVKDSRDSEKVQTISADVQRSLNNSSRIDTLASEVDELKKFKETLSARSWQIWFLFISLIVGNIWAWFIR
jgi:hypothetical protein